MLFLQSVITIKILKVSLPTDFHLFRSLQHFLSDNKFEILDAIQNAISSYFAQKPIDFYQSGIENLHTRWQKVVDNESDYIND